MTWARGAHFRAMFRKRSNHALPPTERAEDMDMLDIALSEIVGVWLTGVLGRWGDFGRGRKATRSRGRGCGCVHHRCWVEHRTRFGSSVPVLHGEIACASNQYEVRPSSRPSSSCRREDGADISCRFNVAGFGPTVWNRHLAGIESPLEMLNREFAVKRAL